MTNELEDALIFTMVDFTGTNDYWSVPNSYLNKHFPKRRAVYVPLIYRNLPVKVPKEWLYKQ